ncbi:ABC transporter substrate-binding protein [Kribbella sp. CA-245084]|uniref:ABC transporter substrate-binding protein n=1 Tax=Kribbella sp. CA-245084 TaxID=3239940 RepID=UPI003D8AF9FF
MRSIRPLHGAALSLAALLTVTACGSFASSGSSGGSANIADRSLTIALQFTPKAGYALETDDAFVLSQVGCLETLLKYDFDSGQLQPLLATKWTQTSPTAWDFTLREGVKFQDGTALDAAGVAFALNKLLKSATPPRAFTPKVISTVQALNATTVRITTPTPSALLPYRVASVNTGILSKAAYAGRSIDVVKHCTGPFTITAQKPQQSMSLARNDGYWGTKATLAKAEAKFLPDGNARATQVRTGESQVALGLPAASIQELQGDKSIVVSDANTPRTTGLYMNDAKAPFTDPDVRKAIQMTVDLDAIAKTIYSGTVTPAFGPFASSEPWAPKGVQPSAKNVDAAKALLQKAGYGPGKLSLSLRAYTERPEFADLAAVVQEQLKQIGITVKVTMTDYAGLEPSLLNGSYDLALLSRNHLTDIADPAGFFEADYTCKGTFNISHYCDPAFDAKVAQAGAEKDPAARYAIYADLAKQLEENAVTVYLVSDKTIAARRSGVQNFVDDPLGRYALTPQLSLTD